MTDGSLTFLEDGREIKTYNADTNLDLAKSYAEFLKYIGK